MPNKDSKTYIINDQATEIDALDFTPYVETLADIIQTGNTPLTIGVFGTWGSGKTSLMKMVKNKLPNDFTVAWFDAWKYDKEETLWRAFLLNVLLAVEAKSGETEELKKLKTMLYRGLEIEKAGGVTIDLAKLGAKVAEGAIQIGLSFIPPLASLADLAKDLQKSGKGSVEGGFEDAIWRERTKIYVEQVRSLEQFQEKFATLIQSYISPNRLVVFVDDLDRCLPEKSIQVLEAIKLFLDVKDCVFVLGIDQDVIARGIEIKYREFKDNNEEDRFTIEGNKYLEKIIQLPFQIPLVEQADMGDFVHGLSTEWPHEECPKVFAEGLGNNPRQIKRTVNVFLMLWTLAKKRGKKLEGLIKPLRLAKVVAIQTAAPQFYELLKVQHSLLRDVEAYYRIDSAQKTGRSEERIPEGGGQTGNEDWANIQLPPELLKLLTRTPTVRQILLLHPANFTDANFVQVPYAELKFYFTLTRRAEVPQTVPSIEGMLLEPQVVKIPAGEFLIGSTQEQIASIVTDSRNKNWFQNEMPQHTLELSEYSIGKYPVTNHQYQNFVRDAKHNPPRGWNGDQFPAEKGGHPVVNVSWNDAIAYCKWLSEKSRKQYRLPTEAEWEKAARGEKGLIYPWGNEFDIRANTKEAKIRGTSEVGQFSPLGDSPYGCADMIGNVWEWTSSLWGKDWESLDFKYPYDSKDGRENLDVGQDSIRVLRGGSFYDDLGFARCAVRLRRYPNFLDVDFGFRVAFSPAK